MTGASFAIDRRQLVLGGALIAATAAATALRPQRSVGTLPGDVLETLVPRRIGRYRYASSTGLIVPAPGDVSEQIYDHVLTRIYVADGVPAMMLLIAYGSAQDAGIAVHRPEACYPSSGYSMGPATRVPLGGDRTGRGSATYLSAARGDRVEQIYFWTRIGTMFPASPLNEKLDVLKANLRGILPDGVLVRLSVRSTDHTAALDQLTAFNRSLLDATGAAGRRLLLGPGG